MTVVKDLMGLAADAFAIWKLFALSRVDYLFTGLVLLRMGER
jgi:hypothetical protein